MPEVRETVVPAGAVTGAVRRHADHVHDLVRRLGADPQAAPALVEATAMDLVASAADRPAELPELLGRWFGAAAQRARAGAPDAGPPGRAVVGSGPLGSDPEQALLAAGLAGREPGARTALLLGDAYGLPAATVAGGLGLPVDDALALVGRARLELLPEVYACDDAPAGAPAGRRGHPPAPTLARLAGPDPQRPDAGAVRHLRSCPRCAEDVRAQQDVRRLLGSLAVVALPDEGREAMLERVAVRARSLLPAQAPVARAPGRVLTPAPVALSLLLAVLLGVGLGALLARPQPAAQAQARPLAPVMAPKVTPLPGDVPRPPDPAPSTLVFTYPPTPTTPPAPTPTPAAPPPSPPPSTPAAPTGSFVLSPAAGPAGSPIRVNGAGWAAGAAVTLVLLDPAGEPTGIRATVAVGPAGRFQASLAAGPAGAAPGAYQVQATQDGYAARAPYTVQPPPTRPQP
ncbi:MAG TPA: hypothetical protein VFR07_10175 [Mycobacteriales bacterium]|nr:hypothetical protein [Mycobacteriales bacterium]